MLSKNMYVTSLRSYIYLLHELTKLEISLVMCDSIIEWQHLYILSCNNSIIQEIVWHPDRKMVSIYFKTTTSRTDMLFIKVWQNDNNITQIFCSHFVNTYLRSEPASWHVACFEINFYYFLSGGVYSIQISHTHIHTHTHFIQHWDNDTSLSSQ